MSRIFDGLRLIDAPASIPPYLADSLAGLTSDASPAPERPPMPALKGWQYPRCGSVYAPFVDRCWHCGPSTRASGAVMVTVGE